MFGLLHDDQMAIDLTSSRPIYLSGSRGCPPAVTLHHIWSHAVKNEGLTLVFRATGDPSGPASGTKKDGERRPPTGKTETRRPWRFRVLGRGTILGEDVGAGGVIHLLDHVGRGPTSGSTMGEARQKGRRVCLDPRMEHLKYL